MNLLDDNNLQTQLKEIESVVEKLEKINNETLLLKFLTVEDLIKATGFSRKRVLELFNDPEFPCCNFGKKQIVEINAALAYFSVPRRKEYSVYWRNL